MTFQTRTLGTLGHVAYLDPMHGCGLLVCPDQSADVWLGPESLLGSAWDVAVRLLASQGWEPLADDDGLPLVEGHTPAGREVVALYALDPMVSLPSVDDLATSTAVLRLAAAVVPVKAHLKPTY